MRRFLISLQITILGIAGAACGSSQSPAPNANSAGVEKVCDPISDSPGEAYKRLYGAVKEKDTAKIKGEMSSKSREFAESLAQRQNNPVDKVYENGFTGTTFSPTLPAIRDERVGGCWGAVEVRNTKEQRWEDLPFVNEEGSWKFAIGELFAGTYKSPGKGMDQREKEAANVARGNTAIPNMMANTNVPNANVNINKPPKYDGPQVEPLPKKK